MNLPADRWVSTEQPINRLSLRRHDSSLRSESHPQEFCIKATAAASSHVRTHLGKVRRGGEDMTVLEKRGGFGGGDGRWFDRILTLVFAVVIGIGVILALTPSTAQEVVAPTDRAALINTNVASVSTPFLADTQTPTHMGRTVCIEYGPFLAGSPAPTHTGRRSNSDSSEAGPYAAGLPQLSQPEAGDQSRSAACSGG